MNILQALSPLHTQLSASITGQTWHSDPWYFRPAQAFVTGCLELSPARHQMGHYVSAYHSCHIFVNENIFSMKMLPCPGTLIPPWDSSGYKLWFSQPQLYWVHCQSSIHSCMTMECEQLDYWEICLPQTTQAWTGPYPSGSPHLPIFHSLQTSPPPSTVIPNPMPVGMMS